MNTTEYKGFNIVDLSERFYITVVGSKSRGAEGFNPDGYATLNNAKGAITKFLNAQASEEGYLQPDGTVGDTPHHHDLSHLYTKPATSDDTARASVPVASKARVEVMTQALRDGDTIGWTGKVNAKGEPIHGDPKLAKIYAELDYYGMSKTRDNRSRNQREGKYKGHIFGLAVRGHNKTSPFYPVPSTFAAMEAIENL